MSLNSVPSDEIIGNYYKEELGHVLFKMSPSSLADLLERGSVGKGFQGMGMSDVDYHLIEKLEADSYEKEVYDNYLFMIRAKEFYESLGDSSPETKLRICFKKNV